MTTAPARRLFVTAFVLTAAAASVLLAQSAQQNAADADRLVKALEIRPGATVGELGAGGGELTIAMAKVVGESGRVFSNELNKDRVKALAARAEQAGLKNIVAVEGRETDTNFSDQCCDAIFMRNVYHHFGDPAAMGASLFKSLKPGGRLAVVDFTPPPGQESLTPSGRSEDGHHGVTAPTVERELKAAGFELVSSTEIDSRAFMVVARRPTT